MIIYLVRHGQTTGDVEDLFGGDYEDHLTDVGKQQSQKLAEQLEDKGIQALFTSPRIRAQETAKIVAAKLNLPVTVLKEFRERNSYGDFTGKSKKETALEHPDIMAIFKNPRLTGPGAEDYAQFQRRITQALEKASKQSTDVIAIITHGGPISLTYREILELGELQISDCAYAAIEAEDNTYKLIESSGIQIRR